MLTRVIRHVPVLRRLGRPCARIQRAIETFLLIDPELKVTLIPLGIATESRLRFLRLQLIQDLPVGDVAHLIVLLHDQAFPIAYGSLLLPGRHHGSTRIIGLTQVAVDASPPIVALAAVTLARQAIFAFGQRAAQRFRAVLAAEARRTSALPGAFGAVGELVADEVVEVAIEAWRAVFRPLVIEATATEGISRKEGIVASVVLERL